MKCKDIELMIQNNDITDDVKSHLLNCESCELYKELFEFSPKEIIIEADVNLLVNKAIHDAEIIKNKHSLLSLLLFIIIASTLLSSVFLFKVETIEFILKRYVLILSGIMPFSLPVIALIRRKVVSNDN